MSNIGDTCYIQNQQGVVTENCDCDISTQNDNESEGNNDQEDNQDQEENGGQGNYNLMIC